MKVKMKQWFQITICTTKFILENLAHHVIFAIPSEWEMSLWLISGDGKNKE